MLVTQGVRESADFQARVESALIQFQLEKLRLRSPVALSACAPLASCVMCVFACLCVCGDSVANVEARSLWGQVGTSWKSM